MASWAFYWRLRLSFPPKGPQCQHSIPVMHPSVVIDSGSGFISWLDTANRCIPLIDFRPPEIFALAHIIGSSNIPTSQIESRASELPPRGTPLIVLVSTTIDGQSVLSYLQNSSYVIHQMCLVTGGWEIEDPRIIRNSSVSAVVWEPSPTLKSLIDEIEMLRERDGLSKVGTAVDLACGGGRDIVFLALRGWNVLGYDYQESSLSRAHELAKEYGTTIETECLDLEIESLQVEQLRRSDIVNVARYLHRPLFPIIAQLVNPGGFVVYHTFMIGCSKPRKEKFLLQFGELSSTFSQLGFDILHDTVNNISDGRPCSWFCARKRQ